MHDFLMPGLILAALLVGVAVSWLWTAGRSKSVVAAAVAEAAAVGHDELVQLRERVRAGEESKKVDQTSVVDLKREADLLRNQLNAERDQTATLTERASRVPRLEQDVFRLTDVLRTSDADVRRYSNEAAQQGQAVALLNQQVAELTNSHRDLAAKLEHAGEALAILGERKAALEEQASRIPGLDRNLDAAGVEVAQLQAQLTGLRETVGAETARLVAEREAHTLVRDEFASERAVRSTADATIARLNEELTHLRTTLDAERKSGPEKLSVILEAKEALSDQFKTLASEILEEKSKRFAEQNQTTLGQLLDPLRTQLTEFKGKVEEVYFQEGMARSALAEQVKGLVVLNQTLSREANNLTSALRGQAKTQGNWGELILEQVLEASGLRKGFQYRVQDSQVREDGSRAQPDVVIHLPEDRRLVVDAKVSLVAFERHVSAETDDARALALRQHIESLRAHVRGLSEKKYEALYGLQSLDFVIAFVPVEPAFMVAVTGDANLFMDAWERNVLLVSPSTLLFVVRTVAHLWNQDAQTRNSQEIARRGAELYDKFCGFAADLQEVGKRISQAKESFDAAENKLLSGRGNVVRQAEMLKSLGVKPSKALPRSLVERASQDEDAVKPGAPAILVAASVSVQLAPGDGTQGSVLVASSPTGSDP